MSLEQIKCRELEEWEVSFGDLCDWLRSEILSKLMDMGYTVTGMKNGKFTALSALAPAGNRANGTTDA